MPKAELERLFPNLQGSRYSIESERTDTYNCVAWAAGITDKWWWPEDTGFWPVEPKVPTVESFVAAFKTLSYEPCDSPKLEAGYEKVAIYVGSAGFPTHVARQLNTGAWTSKLGDLEDITHALAGLEGPVYGRVEQILRRLKPDATTLPANSA